MKSPKNKTHKIHKKMYAVIYTLVGWFLRLIFCVKITGKENEPKDGAFIVCPNHISNADTMVVAVSLKSQLRFLAKAELFKIPILAQFLRAIGSFPIERGKGDIGAIRTTLDLLKQGEVIAMYPQGTRYSGVDPRDTKVRQGIGMIAYRSGVPILPICVETKDFKLRLFRRTNVRIGKPIYPDELGFEHGNSEEYRIASELVFSRITDMIEKEHVSK